MTRDQKIENIFKSGQYESVTWDGGLWLGLRVKKKKWLALKMCWAGKLKRRGVWELRKQEDIQQNTRWSYQGSRQ